MPRRRSTCSRSAATHFARIADFPEIAALWWPRFERIARWFVTAGGRAPGRRPSAPSKAWGTLALDAGFRARRPRRPPRPPGRRRVSPSSTTRPARRLPSTRCCRLRRNCCSKALIARGRRVRGHPGGRAVARLEYYRLSGRGEGGDRASARLPRRRPRQGRRHAAGSDRHDRTAAQGAGRHFRGTRGGIPLAQDSQARPPVCRRLRSSRARRRMGRSTEAGDDDGAPQP